MPQVLAQTAQNFIFEAFLVLKSTFGAELLSTVSKYITVTIYVLQSVFRALIRISARKTKYTLKDEIELSTYKIISGFTHQAHRLISDSVRVGMIDHVLVSAAGRRTGVQRSEDRSVAGDRRAVARDCA